ncbi:hypothetical protein [Serratia marcescens]|nr:hypothetical protein [Serratia marcescens]HDT6550071.1 hypothetical protein [Serratia marcescens]
MNILDETPKKMTFRSNGSPIEPELRPIWRIAIITLILKNLCRGSKSNLRKIQVIYSIVASKDKREEFTKRKLDSNYSIRFDPLVDRAVALAIGEGILKIDESKSISLTNKGNEFYKKISNTDELLNDEKEFMAALKKSDFTEENINKLLFRGVA